MDEEISFEHEGTKYTGIYSVHGDELIVYLPDGSQRATTLHGLDTEIAALTHLREFVLHSKSVDRTGSRQSASLCLDQKIHQ